MEFENITTDSLFLATYMCIEKRVNNSNIQGKSEKIIRLGK